MLNIHYLIWARARNLLCPFTSFFSLFALCYTPASQVINNLLPAVKKKLPAVNHRRLFLPRTIFPPSLSLYNVFLLLCRAFCAGGNRWFCFGAQQR